MIPFVGPRKMRMRALRGLVGVLAIGLLVAACGGSGGSGVPSGSGGTQVPSGSAEGSAVGGSPSAGHAANQTADDGARIVTVQTVGPRTIDLLVDSPAVGGQLVRLLVPSDFYEHPSTRWPVLYLLHGAQDSYVSWTRSTDVVALTEPTDLLVVMPSAGNDGFYSDWWNGGAGGTPRWETFHLTELRQLLERNWHAGNKRVIAGLSMGGLGAMLYAERHPGMFLAAASFSGVLNPFEARWDVDPLTWGDPDAQADIWQAHDPTLQAAALKGIPLYVSYGNGEQGPLDAAPKTDDIENLIAPQNEAFVEQLRELNIPVTVEAYGPGYHAWPYWERELHHALPLLLRALGE